MKNNRITFIFTFLSIFSTAPATAQQPPDDFKNFNPASRSSNCPAATSPTKYRTAAGQRRLPLVSLGGGTASRWFSFRQKGQTQVLISASKDNGTGIPEEVKAKIFQPFFTTKPTEQGTGLGLSLAYDIVTKGHGGTLEVESGEGKETEFTIHIPC